MGWDDDEEDEWDVDDIEEKLQAQLKEKEKARRREEGLDSESEEEKEASKADESKPKPKPKPKVDKKKAQAKKEEEPVPVLSSQEEKLRQRKLVEEADARLANDLFSGCEKPKEMSKAEEEEEKAKKEKEEAAKKAAAKPKIVVVDAFDKVELKVQGDVEQLCATCVEKINKGQAQAKGGASKFLVDLFKHLETSLDTKDLLEFEKAVNEAVKQKQQEKGARLAKDNKANTKLSKTTKFNTASEWEEVYGGGEGDEDWTQEEWDEWYKSK